jgi:hypothetical protein
MRKPMIPTEGDLLFEKKPLYREVGFFWIVFLISPISTYILIKDFIFNPNIYYGIIAIVFLAFSLFGAWLIFTTIKEGLNDGFDDESYKAYYFSDKIVFYRISRMVDKSQINFRRERVKLNNEKIKLFGEPQNQEEISELAQKIMENIQLEKEIEALEKSPSKPHKIELNLSEVKYFMNEKNEIKMVLEYQEDENNLDAFFNKLVLAPKYKNHQKTIVEFLNQRVAAFNSK